MPTISIFYGIIITMYWDDHAPPHFHASYGDFEVLIEIKTLEVLKGKMPSRPLAMVLEWAQYHRREIMEDWELCVSGQTPKKIAPLK
jgi:hypothetical protein